MKSMLKQVVALSLVLSVPAVFAAEKATGETVVPVVPMYKRAGSTIKRGAIATKNVAVRGAVATKDAAVRAGSAAKVKAVAAGNYALNTKAGKFVWNSNDSRTKRAAKLAGAAVVTVGAAVAVNKAYKNFVPTSVQNSSFNPVNWPSMVYNKAKSLVSKKETKVAQADKQAVQKAAPKAHAAQPLTPAQQYEMDRQLAMALQMEEDAKAAQTPVIELQHVAPKAHAAQVAQPARPEVKRAQRRFAAAQQNRGCRGGVCSRPAKKQVRFARVCRNGMCSRNAA